MVMELYESHPMDSRITGPVDISPTVSAHFHKGGADTPLVVNKDVTYCMGRDERSAHFEPNKADPVVQSDYKQPPIVGGGKKLNGRVRRLTPIECERLQGLPDNWTAEGLTEDGKVVKMSDSARYKMIGNGMAQPCADYVIQRITKVMNNGDDD